MTPANDPKFRKAGEVLLVIQPEGRGIEREEATDEEYAMEVAMELEKHYPGHAWIVSFQGGALILRNVEIAHAVMVKTGKSGFGSVMPPHRMGSKQETKRNAVRFAGELLEAFQIPRGRWDPQNVPVCPDWKRGKTSGFR
jgi:hypothetical protein